MKLFSKKETLNQNLALMAMMAGVTLIISVLATFVPILGVFIIIVLPLTSTIVELCCKDKYYPIYAFATIGLCLAANFWNFGVTIYYVIPSIFTGFIFGLMAKKGIPTIWSILIASIIQFGLTFGSLPIVKILCNVDMIETFRTIFKFQDYDIFKIVFPSFLFFVSSIQVVLSFVVANAEIQKLGFEPKQFKNRQWVYQLILLVGSLGIIPLSFGTIASAYIALIIAFYLAVCIILDFINIKAIPVLITFLAGIPLTVIGFAFLYKLMPYYTGFLLLVIFPLWVSIVALVASYIRRKKSLS